MRMDNMINLTEAALKLGISQGGMRSLCHGNNIRIWTKFYVKQFIYIDDFNKIEKIINEKALIKKKKKEGKISNEEVKERIKKATEFKEKNNGIDIHFMKELD